MVPRFCEQSSDFSSVSIMRLVSNFDFDLGGKSNPFLCLYRYVHVKAELLLCFLIKILFGVQSDGLFLDRYFDNGYINYGAGPLKFCYLEVVPSDRGC